MTTTDHRGEAERMLDDAYDFAARGEADAALADSTAAWAIPHALLAIHDELRAIRDRMTEPRWIVPDVETAPNDDTCCDCHLLAVIERGKAVEERDRARREAEALAEEVDGLRSERALDLDTIERLREQRDDLDARLSHLLCDLTRGRLSKTTYDVRTMVQEVEESFSGDMDEVSAERDDLAVEVERLREERDRARTQVISLTGERDDLRATVARVEALVERQPMIGSFTANLEAIRAALEGDRCRTDRA